MAELEEPTSDMISKIKKLLTKAERTSNEHERAAFNEKAERLMVKWGIEEAVARAASGGEAKPEPIIERSFDVKSPSFHKALVMLSHSISTGMGLSGFHSGWNYYHVVGHESDVERYTFLFNSLKIQALEDMRAWWKRNGHHYSHQNARAKNTVKCEFIESYGRAVRIRLIEMNKEETDLIPGSALVLRDRSQEVADYMKEKTGLGKGSNPGFGGNAAGFEAGKKANLGEKQLGATKAIAN